MEERYYKFSTYLKNRFGQKVHKVSLDAGFSCPNRDGKLSKDGCIYCDNKAFNFQSRVDDTLSLEKQIEQGISAARKRFNAQKFIIYFQAYTNTYAARDILKSRYDMIRNHKDIVGLSVATRPDCISEDVLDLIAGYQDDYEVWVEYGLQSIHDKTLSGINRGHSYADFLKAVELTRPRGIKICSHVILGLPGETRAMMMETAKEMARLKVDGIKIHPLHIVKWTKLHNIFKEGGYRPLDLELYIDILGDFLGLLWPETIVQRVDAYCPQEILVAPEWVSERGIVEPLLEKSLLKKGSFQGQLCGLGQRA